MIITKKKFEEAIKKAREEEYEKIAEANRRDALQSELIQRLSYYDRRMDDAFCDIERRLSALEKSRQEEVLTRLRY